MEKDLFPSRVPDLPPADRAPRMDRAPEGHVNGTFPQMGCGCGSHHGGDGNHSHGDGGCGCGHTDGHEGHHHDAPHGGCGSVRPAERPCGVCVGFEGCDPTGWGLCEYPVAMVYAPCQVFRGIYDPATALCRGTLFTELDLPLGREGGFTAEGCACRCGGAERRRT